MSDPEFPVFKSVKCGAARTLLLLKPIASLYADSKPFSPAMGRTDNGETRGDSAAFDDRLRESDA